MDFTFGNFQMLFETKSGEVTWVIKLDDFGKGKNITWIPFRVGCEETLRAVPEK